MNFTLNIRLSRIFFDFHIYFSNIILNQQHMHTVLSKNIFQKSRFCQNIAICYSDEYSIKYEKLCQISLIETILFNIRFVCTHINCCYSAQYFVKFNTIDTTFSQVLKFMKMHTKHFLTIFRLFLLSNLSRLLLMSSSQRIVD